MGCTEFALFHFLVTFWRTLSNSHFTHFFLCRCLNDGPRHILTQTLLTCLLPQLSLKFWLFVSKAFFLFVLVWGVQTLVKTRVDQGRRQNKKKKRVWGGAGTQELKLQGGREALIRGWLAVGGPWNGRGRPWAAVGGLHPRICLEIPLRGWAVGRPWVAVGGRGWPWAPPPPPPVQPALKKRFRQQICLSTLILGHEFAFWKEIKRTPSKVFFLFFLCVCLQRSFPELAEKCVPARVSSVQKSKTTTLWFFLKLRGVRTPKHNTKDRDREHNH